MYSKLNPSATKLDINHKLCKATTFINRISIYFLNRQMLIKEIMARMNHESSSSQTYGSVLMMMIVFNTTNNFPISMVNFKQLIEAQNFT
jgi:hypothetical protein